LPKTTHSQAIYWKAFYNTNKGAGTPEHFMEIINDCK